MTSINSVTTSFFPNEGISPAQEKANQIFFRLGENWWKQIFDGEYHQYGKMVFDEGLHRRGATEPGFYESACNAFHFAGKHLGGPVTPEFYSELNKIACAHFKGKENNTEMSASEAGKMRTKSFSGTRCRKDVIDLIKFYFDKKENEQNLDKLLRNFKRVRGYYPEATKEQIEEVVNEFPERDYPLTLEMFKKFDEILKIGMGRLIDYLKHLKETSIGASALPVASLNGNLVYIDYASADCFPIVEALFKEFNSNIQKAQSADEKLILIADLYQKLEWFHPFQDGQGRTDLILLSKLLAENGLNPPVLFDPYLSTYVPLEVWVQYLKEGMEAWKRL